MLGLVGAVLADVFAESFWTHHSLLAGLTSSLIVVLLTIALLDEAVELRQRQRWSVLAQYVVLQLVCQARLVWTELGEVAGLVPCGAHRSVRVGGLVSEDSAPAGAREVRDTARLSAAVDEVLTDCTRRRNLQVTIDRLADAHGDILARWAGVMLTSRLYAEVIDRHVELASDLGRIGSRLRTEGEIGDLVTSLAAMTQRAEQLDQATLHFALQIVPVGWWTGEPTRRLPGSASG